MQKLRDKVWIWGHPAHSLVNEFDLDGNVNPADGMEYFGAKNVFYVPMHNVVDRDACSLECKNCLNLGWSIENADQVDGVLDLANKYDNITVGVFDDFFNQGTKGSYEHYTVEKLNSLKQKMHENKKPLDMWLVYYTMNTNEKVLKDFLPIFDGVILWFWHETDNANFEQKLQEFLKRHKNQKRMVGCYLYDFGNKKQSNSDTVLYQLNRAKELLVNGLVDGLVLHTNGVVGMGFEAVELAKKWMEENGDIAIP